MNAEAMYDREYQFRKGFTHGWASMAYALEAAGLNLRDYIAYDEWFDALVQWRSGGNCLKMEPSPPCPPRRQTKGR